jgi:ABC-2 type transport system permease protein
VPSYPNVGPNASSAESAGSPRGAAVRSYERRGLAFLAKVFALVAYDARKIRHDPTDLLTRAVQPALWLVVFGTVFSKVVSVPTGGLPYLDYLAPGILAQSVMFICIFYGIQTIWERDLGLVYKFVASPTPRSAFLLGKGLSGGVRGLSQALVVVLLAVALGVQLRADPLAWVGVLAVILVMAVLFVSFSTIIAALVKTQDRFMGFGQLLTMPLFFLSSAIYPIALMPAGLRPIADANPLSYAVDALRALMIGGGSSSFGLATDFGVLAGYALVLVAVGAYLYPRMAQ